MQDSEPCLKADSKRRCVPQLVVDSFVRPHRFQHQLVLHNPYVQPDFHGKGIFVCLQSPSLS